jgi:hypothetical protein
MMKKKISVYWLIAVGLLSVAAQALVFYARFNRWNTDSSFLDYAMFFVSGCLGGWILVYFLNIQDSLAGRWSVLIAFLLASPISLSLMVGGGLFGPLGVTILPSIPWALFCRLGSATGQLLSKDVG